MAALFENLIFCHKKVFFIKTKMASQVQNDGHNQKGITLQSVHFLITRWRTKIRFSSKILKKFKVFSIFLLHLFGISNTQILRRIILKKN
jgi:hypothetical protein